LPYGRQIVIVKEYGYYLTSSTCASCCCPDLATMCCAVLSSTYLCADLFLQDGTSSAVTSVSYYNESLALAIPPNAASTRFGTLVQRVDSQTCLPKPASGWSQKWSQTTATRKHTTHSIDIP
jgi:hypothetical protein